MKRMQLKELLKNVAAFSVVSASAVDAGLLLADRTGAFDVDSSWYVNAPLAAWTLVGIPVSFHLASRIVEQVKARSDSQIFGGLEGAPAATLSRIPFSNGNGTTATILANDALTFDDGPIEETYHPALWRVVIDGVPVTVRERELQAFLDTASKRTKHQFSRRYWTEQRRPAMYRLKYDAVMTLLVKAGLVEGRHEQGRASGYLVTKPRHAVTYLKYESPFRAA